ncbi:hypothetical protein DYE49_06850 [Treponema rectale]|uniref:Uncharacterized protein n=1 Tax=Treponema rectale TaxID=744512 RepID=A0A840SB99_9SPIR|nr:hypothetical protein [Treponema rectale]MBB5218104.1 hypothetical protein [Treponema rectale]QOS40184.1 hypothetical protein DYE49_06850 [Treponema rectale]
MERKSVIEQRETSEDVVFHYKKGSFREKESEEVRNLATGKTAISSGFFKSLVATKGNRFMFIALVIMFALSGIIWFFNSSPETDVLEKFTVTVSAFSYEDKVFAKVEFRPSRNGKVTEDQKFSIHYDAVNVDDALQNSGDCEFVYTAGGEGSQYATFWLMDYDIKKVLCTVSDGERKTNVSCTVVR